MLAVINSAIDSSSPTTLRQTILAIVPDFVKRRPYQAITKHAVLTALETRVNSLQEPR